MVTILQIDSDVRYNVDALKKLAGENWKLWHKLYADAASRELQHLVRSLDQVSPNHHDAMLNAVNKLRREHPTVYGTAVDKLEGFDL